MKKKYCLVVLFVLCVLVSFSSCKKTEDGTSPLSAITSFFKGEAKTTSPVVPESKAVTPVPQVSTPSAPKEEAPSKATAALLSTPTLEPVSVEPQKESVEEPMMVSVLYRGGSYLIHGEFQETEATLICRNMTDHDIAEMLLGLEDSYPNIGNIFQCQTEGDELHLTYEKMSEREIRAYWSTLINFLDSFNAVKSAENVTVTTFESAFGTVRAEIYPMEARIAIPSTVTDEDVAVFLGTLATENPEVIDFCTYSYSDGVIILSFQDAVEEETALYYWDKIVDALLPYGASPYGMEASKEEAVPAEKPEEKTPTTVAKVENGPAIASSKVDAPVVPLTKAGSFIKEKSYAVTSSLGFNGSADFSLQGRFEARVSDNLSFGIKTGYQTKAFLPVVAYGKMDLLSNVYAFAGLGFRLGLGNEDGGLVLEVGAGYEWEITDQLKVFAEGILSLEGTKPGIRAVIGGRYVIL